MTKNEKFNNYILREIKKLGAVEDDRLGGRWHLETIYGDLRISLSTYDRKSKIYTVFTQFSDVERAREGMGVGKYNFHARLNPHSGKWNFHTYSRKLDHRAYGSTVINQIKRLLPVKETEETT